MPRPLAMILGLCATAVLVGCGTVTLGSGKVATLMRGELVRQGLAVRSVSCPAGIREGTGIVTYCSATLADGDTVRMSATQTSHGIEVAPAEMIADAIQSFIVRTAKAHGVVALAVCPQHRPIIVGSTFDCVARDRHGHSVTVHVTVASRSGAFRILFAGR